MKAVKSGTAVGPPMRAPVGSGLAQVLKETGGLVKSFGRDRAALVFAWVVADLVSASSGWIAIATVQVIFGLMYYAFRKRGIIVD